jgi:6-phosphogluconolactonase
MLLLRCLCALAFAGLYCAAVAGADDAKADKYWMYVGTYSRAPRGGIFLFEFDPANGTLTPKGLAAATNSPSFLAIHPNRRYLYAVGEGNKAVSAFSIDQKTGQLTLLNQQSSEGAGPCHLVVDKTGKYVLVANYSGGNGCVLPIQADGSLGAASDKYEHKGEVADKKRQGGPHAHSINLDAGNRYAMVADLGLDRVFVYRFDPEKGTLTKNDPEAAKVAPRSGPRHFAFHPNGKYAYAINEISLTVTAFAYDPSKGVLTELQTISTLPENAKGKNFSTAEVLVHPSGKFLYGSNRGHDSIAIFKIDPESGKLTAAGHVSGPIKEPRNFAMDPAGRYLFVENQNGDSIVVYKINQETGALDPTGQTVEVPKPVCIKMMPVPK